MNGQQPERNASLLSGDPRVANLDQASDWPRISVITVFYNPGPLLEKTIINVLEQEYPNLDYVLIDDCSTDGSEEVARKYRGQVRYRKNSRNLGIYGAMNEGIKFSDGQWLNFLNSGDVFAGRDILRRVGEKIRRFPEADFVYGKYRMVGPAGDLQLVKGKEVGKEDWYFRTAICHQAVFTRRNLFSEIGHYDASMKIVADYDWFVKYFSREDIHPLYLDRVLVDFLIDGASFRYQLVGFRERLKIVKNNFSGLVYLLNWLRYVWLKVKMKLIFRFYDSPFFQLYRRFKYRPR